MGSSASLIRDEDGDGSRKMSFRSTMQMLFASGTAELTGVDKELHEMRKLEKFIHKILLLGAGESGKSTVLKQIKLLSKIPLSDREIEEYTINIRRNVIEAIQTLLLVGGELGEELENPGLMDDVQEILEMEL